MSISTRLIILLAFPLVILIAIAGLNFSQAGALERNTRLVAETQIESLATIGRFVRVAGERGIHLRNCILSDDPKECARARAAFEADGLIEQFDADKRRQFGMERLVAMLADLGSLAPPLAVSHAVEALGRWSGGMLFDDDVSIVILDWKPSASHPPR
jgi:hypothetical protein